MPAEPAPAEGGAGDEIEHVPARALDPLGIDGLTNVPCLSVRYQIAQKPHACTEVFGEGPANARFRDLIDVLLLRELLTVDDLPRIRAACIETFALHGKHRSGRRR